MDTVQYIERVCVQGEVGERGEGEEVEEKKKKSSILGASFNFTNSIIGAGIIGNRTTPVGHCPN